MTEQTQTDKAKRDAAFAEMEARASVTKKMLSEIKAKLRALDESDTPPSTNSGR